MMDSYRAKTKATTVKNPQGNAQGNSQHKRMHLLMVELLRTQRDEILIPKKSNANKEIRKLLASVAFALRSRCSTVTKYSPSELIFNRDMIIHQKELVNWDQVHERKRRRQILDNERENKSRTKYKYKIGDRVLIIKRKDEPTGKLKDFEHQGPYKVLQVNACGTLKLQRDGFTEPVSIHRLKLYKGNKNKIQK